MTAPLFKFLFKKKLMCSEPHYVDPEYMPDEENHNYYGSLYVTNTSWQVRCIGKVNCVGLTLLSGKGKRA